MRALGAGVAELVDAADSKSASFTRVGVRVPSPVPSFLRKYASFLASATECQSNLAFFRLNLAGWILGVDAREFGQRIHPSGWMLDTPQGEDTPRVSTPFYHGITVPNLKRGVSNSYFFSKK